MNWYTCARCGTTAPGEGESLPEGWVEGFIPDTAYCSEKCEQADLNDDDQ